jgi:YHS domain-containing protein
MENHGQQGGCKVDPVCGRRVSPGQANFCCFENRGERLYFCSQRCQRLFEKRVERQRLIELARAGALLSRGIICWGIA